MLKEYENEVRAKAIAEYNKAGRAFSPNDMRVSDYLNYWLENIIHKNIDHGYTYQTYKGYKQKHMVPFGPKMA